VIRATSPRAMTLPTCGPLAARRALAAAILAAAVVAGCGTTSPPAADSPAGVVQSALVKLQAKDLDGLRSLACAGQEDQIREQLGLAGVTTAAGAGLLPGLDAAALLDAVALDVSKVAFGEPAVQGEVAAVPVTGTVKVTFDAAKMRPIVRQVLVQQGRTMTDEQLDALLQALATYAQDVPVNESIRVVRENGAWKICQETITAPATP
jgi:hypothetical protein